MVSLCRGNPRLPHFIQKTMPLDRWHVIDIPLICLECHRSKPTSATWRHALLSVTSRDIFYLWHPFVTPSLVTHTHKQTQNEHSYPILAHTHTQQVHNNHLHTLAHAAKAVHVHEELCSCWGPPAHPLLSHTHTHTHTHTHAHTPTPQHPPAHVGVLPRQLVCTRSCAAARDLEPYVNIWIRLYTHICICIYIWIYIHTNMYI